MQNALYWLALSDLPEIGAVTVRRWLAIFQEAKNIFLASSAALSQAGLTAKQIAALAQVNWQKLADDWGYMQQNNWQLISCIDSRYPQLLKELHDPPCLLYAAGNLDLLAQSQIAMVGSRHPTVSGAELAYQFAKELSQAGLVITSGLALGIDAASHRGALAATGNTIGVLGTGLKHIYPRAHTKLAEEIIQRGGLLVSEFPLHAAPKAAHFPMRNRIISGLSLGVLVVEAALRSGSLISARCAIEQNREVFAVPGSIHNPLARGCHQLLRQGAKLVETAQDILEEIGIAFTPTLPSYVQEPVDLDPILQRVLAQIGYETTALDVIIFRAGLTASEVSSMLLPLELKGYIRQVPGGYMRMKSKLI